MLLRPGRRSDTATPPADRPTPPADALHARRHLLGLYLLLGLTVSSWLSRLPTVRTALDLSTGELGTVMLVGAVGSLMTVLVAGPVVTRWGSARTMIVAAVVFSVGYLLMGLGPALGLVGVLVAGIVLMSMAFALGNVPLNVETVVVERRMGRTVVPQFHAAFSIGAVLGSAIGAAAAWADVPVLVQFGVVSVVALVWRVVSVPQAVLPPPAPVVAPGGAAAAVPAPRGGGWRTSLRAWRERRTLLIGVVVMSGALSEGSANNWLAIAVVDGFAQTEAVAAVVFGVFVASMTVARTVGTWVIDRFGRYPVLVGSGTLGTVGLLGFGLAPSLPLALLGVVAWGLGAGLIIPIGMAAVSQDPLSAAGRVAVVSAFATVISIGAPPLIGLAAEAVGARHALLLIAGFMVLGVLLAGSIREEHDEDSRQDVVVPDTEVAVVLVPAERTSSADDDGAVRGRDGVDVRGRDGVDGVARDLDLSGRPAGDLVARGCR